MTDALSSFGTLLKLGNGATPEVFTTVAEVGDIAGPEITRSTHEATNHDSTGGWEEFIKGVKRSGQVTFPINWKPTAATHDATSGVLNELANKDVTSNWQLVWPDSGSTTWSFPAHVVGFSPSAPVDGKLTADVTLKITGQPTLA